jgi:GxxExxY protein
MTETERKDPRTYAIIGAAMEVHRSLAAAFSNRFIKPLWRSNSRSGAFPLSAKSPCRFPTKIRLDTPYRVDFICFDEVVVELKAVTTLSVVEEAQVLNYLKASKLEIGLLINFGSRSLQYHRFIFSHSEKSV